MSNIIYDIIDVKKQIYDLHKFKKETIHTNALTFVKDKKVIGAIYDAFYSKNSFPKKGFIKSNIDLINKKIAEYLPALIYPDTLSKFWIHVVELLFNIEDLFKFSFPGSYIEENVTNNVKEVYITSLACIKVYNMYLSSRIYTNSFYDAIMRHHISKNKPLDFSYIEFLDNCGLLSVTDSILLIGDKDKKGKNKNKGAIFAHIEDVMENDTNKYLIKRNLTGNYEGFADGQMYNDISRLVTNVKSYYSVPPILMENVIYNTGDELYKGICKDFGHKKV